MKNKDLDLLSFSKNLKYLIEKNNIKNIDLANYLSVSKSAISNYISGVSVPKLETIVKIASFFDVAFENLITENINKSELAFNEEGALVYKINLFHKQLVSDTIIYRKENYIGAITSPIPVDEKSECYALKSYDNSMKSFGITEKSLNIFKLDSKIFDNDIAVVLIKPEKQLYIRSVTESEKKIELRSDEGVKSFKKTKKGCDVHILGKVILSTFSPNEN